MRTSLPPLRAITLHQFWAFLMSPLVVKLIETRGWYTHHRGPLAIHAAAEVPAKARRRFGESEVIRETLRPHGVLTAADLALLPQGVIVGVCDLVACISTDVMARQRSLAVMGDDRMFEMPGPEEREYAFGEYGRGRFMWFTSGMRVLESPVPCGGLQRLWTVPENIAAQVYEQTGRLAA